jgi:hypothetical protein
LLQKNALCRALLQQAECSRTSRLPVPVPVRDVEDVVAVPVSSAAINTILVARRALRGEAGIRVREPDAPASVRAALGGWTDLAYWPRLMPAGS